MAAYPMSQELQRNIQPCGEPYCPICDSVYSFLPKQIQRYERVMATYDAFHVLVTEAERDVVPIMKLEL